MPAAQQSTERERLDFGKTKWENEREDHRVEQQTQHRFQVLSSLIKKGRTAEEAKALVDLL